MLVRRACRRLDLLPGCAFASGKSTESA